MNKINFLFIIPVLIFNAGFQEVIANSPLGTGDTLVIDCEEARFEEKDGVAVVEIESVAAASGWKKESSVPGFYGDAYYRWDGANMFNAPGSGIMEYKIRIKNPGTYQFNWHNKIMHGTEKTESNDSWLKIPDADDFYAYSPGKNTIRYPKGGMFIQSNLTTEGSSKNGWMKIYCSGTLNWTWKTSTNDNDPHIVFAVFNNPGVYTVQISGRSTHHAIDRFILFNPELYTQAEVIAKEETLCSGEIIVPNNYKLTVNNGSGNGFYTTGDTITISANAAPLGKKFSKWTGDVETIADINSPVTTITIGTENIEVTAGFVIDPCAADSDGDGVNDCEDQCPDYPDHLCGYVAKIPGKIEVEAFSSMSGVKVDASGHHLNYIGDRDWMEYQLAESSAGFYEVNYKLASASAPVLFQLLADGNPVSTVNAEPTGSFATYTIIKDSVLLTTSPQTIGIQSLSSSWNFDWIEFIKLDTLLSGLATLKQSFEAFKIMPNPLVNSVIIEFRLETEGPVKLAVYNIHGKLVDALYQGNALAGLQRLSWDGTDASSHLLSNGIYFLRLTTKHGAISRKISIIR